MKILNASQVARKLKRLAIEIYSKHIDDKEIYFAGINQKGHLFAALIAKEFEEICKVPVHLISVTLNPADPLQLPVNISIDIKKLNGSKIIIFDDVANTGRTFFYACKPFLEILPEKVEMAALIDRKHKLFPIHVDYVGLSLATTLHENIEVTFNDQQTVEAYLG
jgi:pyrimidine operon attenuation protein/uracil phosphoribosyltransferase